MATDFPEQPHDRHDDGVSTQMRSHRSSGLRVRAAATEYRSYDMADASSPPRSRWRNWLPPVILAVAVLIALLLLGEENPGKVFRYNWF
jgi:hypothetical protein